MVENLDKRLIRLSVSRVISDLFYGGKQPFRRDVVSGDVLHYRLGFTGDEVYCRFLELDNYYVKLCGSPDRISLEKGKLYVDELKTTHNHQGFVEKVAYAQLQLYMFLTGIQLGRIWVYDKAKNELKMVGVVTYNESFVRELLRRYINWLESKKTLLDYTTHNNDEKLADILLNYGYG